MSTDEESPQYSREDSQYYIFNAEHKGLGVGPRSGACAFWNDFLPRLQGHPGYETIKCEIVTQEQASAASSNPAFSSLPLILTVFLFY